MLRKLIKSSSFFSDTRQTTAARRIASREMYRLQFQRENISSLSG